MKKHIIVLVSFVFLIIPFYSITQNKLVNQKDLSFIKGPQTLGNTRTFSLDIADVNADSYPDVFIGNYIGRSVLYINDGSGGFGQSGQIFDSSENHGVSIADFNGDSSPDIFLLSHQTPCKIFINDGLGLFTDSGQQLGDPEDGPGSLAVGDIDMDGDQDVFISYYQVPIVVYVAAYWEIIPIMCPQYLARICKIPISIVE